MKPKLPPIAVPLVLLGVALAGCGSSDAGELVSVMVPESAFHKGPNRVEVFLQP